MSLLLKRVVWYRLRDRDTELVTDNSYLDPVDITDDINWNVGKGLDIKNNVLSLTVKNANKKYVENGLVKFSEQDQFKVYLKYVTDNDDVTAAWDENSTTFPGASDLLGIYFLVEFAVLNNSSGARIKIKCTDKTYILFNKVFAKAYVEADSKNPPEIIQEVIRYNTENASGAKSGTSPNSGVKYDIDAKLFSEGIVDSGTTSSAASKKLIEAGQNFSTTVSVGDLVRNTTDNTYATVTVVDSDTQLSLNKDIMANLEGYQISNGFMQDTRIDGSVFPDVTIAKVWKPLYEWINELGSVDKTNSANEVSTNAIIQQRPMIFWVDEENRFHWVYADNTVAATLVTGTDNILSLNLTKKVFDVVNMVIFNAGTDMYGTGIWNYEVDTTSPVRTLKMRVIPMLDITESLVNKDYSAGFVLPASRDAGEGGKGNGYPIPQFPTSYPPAANAFVPTTTYAAAANIGSDSNYNDALRERATNEGKNRARTLLAGLANARYVGSIEITGSSSYLLGDLVQVTDDEVGVKSEKLRIMGLQHNITKTGWFTTLSVEEDPVER